MATAFILAALLASTPTATNAAEFRRTEQAISYQQATTASSAWLTVAIRACLAVRCYKWWPKRVARELQHGHITPAVKAFLRAWFCDKTFLC
ncbi:hypothetical protein [Nonomuraea sp. NPDC050783]|uniref:hypothetical protein n=1 Tax=Nonomuraea sp. NPDC050783 TaxID=3154634 RepID=UPI0034651568